MIVDAMASPPAIPGTTSGMGITDAPSTPGDLAQGRSCCPRVLLLLVLSCPRLLCCWCSPMEPCVPGGA